MPSHFVIVSYKPKIAPLLAIHLKLIEVLCYKIT